MSENKNPDGPRPVAFMVMPFRKRRVLDPPSGAPAEIDCNALWDKAFRPALEKLGYLSFRADMEIGTVIVKDMLERLALADLVLADMTLPNGNVYYEVGLRHVARKTHCILIAADWSKQLFDTDQIRTERYPLKDGSVPEEEADIIRNMLIRVIPEKKDSPTPYYELVHGKENSAVFRRQVEQINLFQTEIRTIRLLRQKEDRRDRVRSLCTRFTGTSLELPEVALELLTLVRDSLGWQDVLDYVETLPPALGRHAFVKEQLFLAQSKLGDHPMAIAGIESMIRLQGDSPERRGLIGGRYKRLWRESRDSRMSSGENTPGLEEIGYLDSAIENYTIGMELDFNEYFCACNLPVLLRTRGEESDEDQAAFLDRVVVRTCKRKIKRGEDDGWAKPTLLGAAFRSKDIFLVKQLALEVAKEGAESWKLKSTLSDINEAIEGVNDVSVKKGIEKVRNQLQKLI